MNAIAASGGATSPGAVVTQPQNTQVFQRNNYTGGLNNLGTGTIPMSVTTTGASTSVDARLRNADTSGNPTVVDWANVQGALAAGSVTLNVPAPAGQTRYLVDLRFNGGAGQIVLGTNPVCMGDLTAFAGQSHAASFVTTQFNSGNGGTIAANGITVSPCVSVSADWGNASSPTTETATSANAGAAWQPPSDSGTYKATWAAEYLNRLAAKTGVAQGLVGYAVGNTSISVWAPGKNYNTKLKAALTTAGGKFRWFIWCQGYADSNGVSTASYLSQLQAIENDMISAYTALPFVRIVSPFPNEIQASGTGPQAQLIRAAHLQYVASDSSAVMVDGLNVALNTDNVHQNQVGNIEYADQFYRAAAGKAGLFANAESGPTITSALLSGAALKLAIAQSSGTNLVASGTLASLFRVYDTGTSNALTISSAAVTGANEVTLTLSATPAGQVDVAYAYLPDTSTSIASSLRDNVTDGDGLTIGRPLRLTQGLTVSTSASGTPATALTMSSPTYDTTAPKFGTAALNGGYGTVASPFVSGQPFTFEAWVKGTAAGTQVAFGGAFWVGQKNGSSNCQVVATGGTNQDLTGGAINDGNWHHIALAVDSASSRFYVDGTLVASSTTITSANINASGTMGVRAWGSQPGTAPWTGSIDEVRLSKNVAQYTANTITVPTAPFAVGSSGGGGIYHLDNDGTGVQ